MPVDFKNKLFQKALWGYDPAEVDGYIAHVAGEYAKLEKRCAALRAQIGSRPESSKETPKETGRPAAAAEEEAGRISAEARETAETILAEARTEAGKTRSEAGDEAGRILSDAREQSEAILSEAHNILEEAKNQAGAVLENAGTEAGKLTADAGSEAEKILTEARERSEAILSEAHAILEDAKDQAGTVLENAGTEAGKIIENAQTEAEEIRSAAQVRSEDEAEEDGSAPAPMDPGMLASAAARFREDVAAFSHAMESLTRTQMNAVRRFTDDAERFFALSPAGSDETEGSEPSGEDADLFGFAAAASVIGDLLRERDGDETKDISEEEAQETAGDTGSGERTETAPSDGGTDAMIADAALADHAAAEAECLREQLMTLNAEAGSGDEKEETPENPENPGSSEPEVAGDEELEAVMAALSDLDEDESYDAILNSFRPEDLEEEAARQAEGIRRYLAEKTKREAEKQAAELPETDPENVEAVDFEAEIAAAVEAAVRAKLDPSKAVDDLIKQRNEPLPRDVLDMIDFDEPRDDGAAYTDHSLTEFASQKSAEDAGEERSEAPEEGPGGED